ncbi:MAG: hypothetical protein CMO47_10760 [Verrucomicrobiales bacterium]|nr:hypothetical protein [Verrucomicrobiales bacterium]
MIAFTVGVRAEVRWLIFFSEAYSKKTGFDARQKPVQFAKKRSLKNKKRWLLPPIRLRMNSLFIAGLSDIEENFP